MDSAGNVYVSDAYAIRKITPAGIVTTLAGGTTGGIADGIGATAQFGYAPGLAVGANGSVYVADSGKSISPFYANNTIRVGVPMQPPTITVTDADGNPVPCGGVKTVSNNGQCGAVTVPLIITASGNCPGTITVASTRNDGHLVTDPYPVGSTVVTSTATDACSNTTTCMFTVTVTSNRTITSNFNGTPIPGNSYLWFNAVLKPSGLNGTNGPVTVRFINQTITSGNFNLNPPDTTVIFDPNAACASTVVTNTGQWMHHGAEVGALG